MTGKEAVLEQIAERLDLEFDFGWRNAGAPSMPGFGVMGWSGSPLRQAARFQCWL